MTQLPLGFGTLDWSDWLRGVISAFVGGGAGAVTSGVVVSLGDPQQYNMGTQKFYVLVGSVFLMSGMMNLMAFLRNKPMPDVKTVTTVETVEHQAHPPATVTTTVEKTEMVPPKA
jgi:hypothetical protein